MRAHRTFQHRTRQGVEARRFKVAAAHHGEPLASPLGAGGQQAEQMPVGGVGPQDIVEQHDEREADQRGRESIGDGPPEILGVEDHGPERAQNKNLHHSPAVGHLRVAQQVSRRGGGNREERHQHPGCFNQHAGQRDRGRQPDARNGDEHARRSPAASSRPERRRSTTGGRRRVRYRYASQPSGRLPEP